MGIYLLRCVTLSGLQHMESVLKSLESGSEEEIQTGLTLFNVEVRTLSAPPHQGCGAG